MARDERWILRGRRILLPGGREPGPATVHIHASKIERVSEALEHAFDFDAGDELVMPGIVDTHAHINEPGRTEWEGFRTATRAAAAGGITTVVEMPLNSVPATTSVSALETKSRSAQGACSIDYGFWGGVIPGNVSELAPMIEAGALGFKAFMIDSGVAEFPASSEADLREAMPILARASAPLLVHAEIDCGSGAGGAHDSKRYSHYVASRPARWEVEAIRKLISLSKETGCRVHIVHLSAAEALPDLAEARNQGIPITVETCPHYLSFCEEEIPDGATDYKCAPPIRGRANRELLWRGLKDSMIDFIVSDHSPCTPALKKLETGDFAGAWGGIAGLQFSLPAVWTGARARGCTLADLARWMSEAPARFAGLDDRKGRIAAGFDADLVVWNPEEAVTIRADQVLHRHPVTPYAGKTLLGSVKKTILRGKLVYDRGQFPVSPQGQWLAARKRGSLR